MASPYDYQNSIKDEIANTIKKVSQLSRGPSRGSGLGVQVNVGVGILSLPQSTEDRGTIR